MLTAASLILVPLAIAIDGRPDFSLAPATWAAMGYFALISTSLAYLIYYRVLAAAGSANLLFVTLIIPPVAIVLGALTRGEALAPGAFLGLALLAAGLRAAGRAAPAPRQAQDRGPLRPVLECRVASGSEELERARRRTPRRRGSWEPVQARLAE